MTEVKQTSKRVDPDSVSMKFIVHRGKHFVGRMVPSKSVQTLGMCIGGGEGGNLYGRNADFKMQVTFCQPQNLDLTNHQQVCTVFSLLLLFDDSSCIIII